MRATCAAMCSQLGDVNPTHGDERHPRKLRRWCITLHTTHSQPTLYPFVTARGFGMRVVGGKTGSDGRSFACIVWTVPGGPAEKAGLQQGDKVRAYMLIFYSHKFYICRML